MPDLPPKTLPQKLLPWLLLLAAAAVGFLFIYVGLIVGVDPAFLDLFKRNYITIVGLPMAMLAALFIVVFLEQTSGPIEFDVLGFKFKGASGPVVLWVLCYLAMVASFKILWVPADETRSPANTQQAAPRDAPKAARP